MHERIKKLDEKNQMEKLMDCLCAIFPGWKAGFGVETAKGVANYKRELIIALGENSVRTEHQIARGLKIARQQNSDFLPNPGKFARWCIEEKKPMNQDFKKLPEPRASDEVAFREIKAIRGIRVI